MMKYIFCFTFLFTLFSCDEISLKEQDVTKYPWLKPFLHQSIANFEGEHDLDKGTLSFNYIYSSLDDDAFLYLDSIARVEQWKLIESSEASRKYSKCLYQYEADTGKTVIEINIDNRVNKIFFNIE